jgi:protein gp37
MNNSKIEWCDSTWNPVTGCVHNCKYCYARNIANRFSSFTETARLLEDEFNKEFGESNEIMKGIYEIEEPLYFSGRKAAYPYGFCPTFHKYRLEDYKDKSSRNIFVCSMADLFGEWVPDAWIQEVFSACKKAPQHTYLFLTKNYTRAGEYKYYNNWWIGRTITNNDAYLGHGDPWNINGINRANQFLSIEPLHGNIDSLKYYINTFKWVIIGAETGNRKNKIVPEHEWIHNIFELCHDENVPIFMKDNLKPYYNGTLVQELPEELKKKYITTI